MPINFKSLGATEPIRRRRLQVLAYHLNHGTPDEIAKKFGIPLKTVYNDISIINKTELHILSQLMEKDLEITALDLKHRELEGRSREYSVDQNTWLKLQTIILENKKLSLKLKGLMSDKVEHSGSLDVNNVMIYIPDNNRDDSPD